MSLVTRQYGPDAKGLKLTNLDMDNNLYYLQSIGVSGLTFSSSTLSLINPTGGTISSVEINVDNRWYIPSGTTVEIESYSQSFIYGDLYVLGELILNQNSQLIILNGNLILSGGTLSGSGQTVLVDLPTFNDLITSGTYSGGTLTLSTSNGSDVTVNGFFTPTNGFTTGVTYNSSTNTITLTDNTNNSLNAYIDGFSGLTVNGILSATTYQNLPDNVTGNYLPLSGGTVTGDTIYQSGLTATTISATTYQNLPIDPDTYVTGYTYSDNTFTIKQNNGQPDLTATIDSVTGMTVNGNLTVTGNTSVQGLTATTISATTYDNLPIDPDTFVTGFTYGNNVFTIKQNNGQSDLTSTINSVTGWTVNGVLTVTGDTSVEKLTANTVKVNDTSGTPDQAASFNVNGRLVAGLGQTTFATFGDSSLTAPTLNIYTLIPNLTQTISVPSNCSVFITTTGGVGTSNNNSNTATVDIAIFIDGALLPSGGFSRINSVNPNAINNGFTNETWAVSTIQTLSAGNHTIDVRVNPRSITGGNIVVSGPINNVRQGELYITIIKN